MAELHYGNKFKFYLSKNGIKERKKAQLKLLEEMKNDTPVQCTEPGCNCMTEPAAIYWQPIYNPETKKDEGLYLFMTKRTLEDDYFFDIRFQCKYILVNIEDIPTNNQISELIENSFYSN